MLWDILKDNIQFEKSVENWEDAIQIASKPLLINKDIEPSYIDAMIDMTKKFNGYIVLNDYFAMPHAGYQYGVNRLTASMLIVNEAVDFMGKPVHVILVLAPIDNTSHMQLIQQIAEYFADVDFIKKLSNTQSVNQISALLKETYGCEVMIHK